MTLMHPAEALKAGRAQVRGNYRARGYILFDVNDKPVKACANGMLLLGYDGAILEEYRGRGDAFDDPEGALATHDARLGARAVCPVRGCDQGLQWRQCVVDILLHLNDLHGWSTPHQASWLYEVIPA